MGKANAEMVQFKTNEQSAIVGKKLHEISFPQKANISAIVRSENLITPYGETKIKEGDFLYILVAKRYKEELKKVLEEKKDLT